eukprot:6972905-Pyramimonas_sp.AAC.1
MVGPESYVVPLRQLDGLNMESGRTPEGKRPTIEKSDQVYRNILDGTAEDQSPQFLLRKAYEQAITEVRSVAIPPGRGRGRPRRSAAEDRGAIGQPVWCI